MSILVVLNVLFFVVNTIDALFLWTHVQILPDRVSYSHFVHEGVNSLVGAVLLSAVVLSAIFQQVTAVSESRALKRLAYVWIAQNVILIAGVMLRLFRYIDAYFLTLLRVYALCFVLLVAVGFVLLAIHIARNKNLNWLLLANGLATLTLFFVLQFLNVAGWVAQYNVTQWERDPAKTLDLGVLEGLGSPAWSAIERLAASRHSGDQWPQQWAKDWLARTKSVEEAALNTCDWRSWQGRHARNTARLLGTSR